MREGVYAMVGGPNYETVAELKMLRELGVDSVGKANTYFKSFKILHIQIIFVMIAYSPSLFRNYIFFQHCIMITLPLKEKFSIYCMSKKY